MPDPKPKRAILCRNLQEKCRTPIPGTAFCACLRSRNARGHFTRAILCGIYRKNAGPQFRGPHFVRTCAVETHMDSSEDNYRKKMPDPYSGHDVNTSIEHRALNPYRKNPFSVATLFGEKSIYNISYCEIIESSVI